MTQPIDDLWDILAWFLALLTTAEWRATLWLWMITLAGTHIIKVTWRNILPISGGGGGQVALVAAGCSMVAAYFVWPAGSVPWWLAGIVGGPASNIAFKIGFALLKRFIPDLAVTVNFDRRKIIGLPPGILERRK